MKHTISALLLIFSLLSCQKERAQPGSDSLVTADTSKLMISGFKHIIFDSEWSEQYSFAIYDSCTQENINFSGLETYKLKQTGPNNKGYSIYYEIDLTGVTGTGEKSNTIYSGGGIIKSMTKSVLKFSHLDTLINYNQDGSTYITIDSIFTESKLVGKDIYKTKFTSAHGEITLSMKNIYKEVNGAVVIDNTGHPILVACKIHGK